MDQNQESFFLSLTTFISKIEKISFYHLYFYDGNTLLYPVSDQDIDRSLAADPSLADFLLSENGIVSDQDDALLFYAVQHYNPCYTCIAGPFHQLPITEEVHQSYAHRHHLKKTFCYPLRRATPHQAASAIDLVSSFLSAAGIHCTEHFTDVDFFQDILFSEHNMEKNEYKIRNYVLEEAVLKPTHGIYMLEKKLFQALQTGNEVVFYEALQEYSRIQANSIATTPLKNAEYSDVMMTAVFTRLVIESGVPEPEAYALSDYLISELSHSHDKQYYDKMFTSICHRYLQLVKRYKFSNSKSSLVEKCKTYISNHLNQPLHVKQLADELNVSKDYLMHIFPESERITLMEYIRRERIEASKNMLKYSDFNITRIANYYQFKSQSHFSAIFRKYTGMTPREYRNTNKAAEFR